MRLDRGHGSPYDRGSADSYYQRSFRPHYFVGDTYKSDEIQRISKESPQHLELFESWSKYFFSGENWNKPKFTEEELNAVRSSLGVI